MRSSQDTALVEDTEEERKTPLAIMQVLDIRISIPKYTNDDHISHFSLMSLSGLHDDTD